MRKRICLIAAAAILLIAGVVLTGVLFGDAPVSHVTVTDPERYMQTNSYVARALSDGKAFRGLLPEHIPERAAAYTYDYDCALLSDPVFSIQVSIPYGEDAAFRAEMQRIAAIAKTKQEMEDKTIFYITGSAEDVKQFLDDEVRDGRIYILEIALADPGEKCIRYLTAQLYEGEACNAEVLQFLKQLPMGR